MTLRKLITEETQPNDQKWHSQRSHNYLSHLVLISDLTGITTQEREIVAAPHLNLITNTTA